MKVLSIGNSFSDDMTAYIKKIADSDGYDLTSVNLFEGGCSLEKHMKNIGENAASYIYEENGVMTERTVTADEIIDSGKWDVITVQQCSGFSGLIDSYYPYIEQLLGHVKAKQPGAKLIFHQTWAYEYNSAHPHFKFYGDDQDTMYNMICTCRDKVTSEFGLDCIRNGDIIQTLRALKPFDAKNGGISMTRDGFHLGLTYGRLAAALSCYYKLSGNDVRKNRFLPENTDPALAQLVRETVYNLYHN